jgi:hypothetical protein
MTGPSPNLRRKRWPWLAIAFLVVIAGAFASRGMKRPASDARFVGRWRILADDGTGSEVILWSNGYGGMSDGRGNFPNRFTWEVRNGILYRSPLTGAVEGRPLVIVWKEFSGPPWWESRADILSVAHDVIEVQATLSSGTKRREVFTRLHE